MIYCFSNKKVKKVMSVLKGIIIMYILAISVAETQLDNMMGKICMICENIRVSYLYDSLFSLSLDEIIFNVLRQNSLSCHNIYLAF